MAMSTLNAICYIDNGVQANILALITENRPGDVRHSLADIGKAKKLTAYTPEISVRQGPERSADWYIQLFQK